MKNIVIVIGSILLVHISILAQTPDTLWAKTYGGVAEESGNFVQQTNDLGYIIAGGTESFGSGGTDIFLIRTNSQGDTLWTKTYGGVNADIAYSVQQTNDGGFIIAGQTASYGVGSNDIWLIKTNSLGSIIWTQTYGGIGNDRVASIKQTPDGGYIISGTTNSFGGAYDNVYIIKTNSSGVVQWETTWDRPDANNDDRGGEIQLTSDGGYIMVGHSYNYNGGGIKVTLLKLDSFGTIEWWKAHGIEVDQRGSSVLQTDDGGYIFSAYTGLANSDFWLVKTDSAGDTLWSKRFGGLNDEYPGQMWATADGGYVIAGYTTSFGAGGKDVWLVKTDQNGNEVWNQTFGGSGDDIGVSVQQTQDEGFIIAGRTNSFGAGSSDVWIIKTEKWWLNQISIEDAGGAESSGVLVFGQHPDATDSIDFSLGEYEIPPPPIAENFDARFILPTSIEVSSLMDLRASSETEITWTMSFQPGPAGYPITFSWADLSIYSGTFYLTDRINGTFVNVNMKNQGSYILTNPAITSLNIIYKGEFCSVVSVNDAWNMISVPYLAEDMSQTNLFPTATSFAYGFDNSYVVEDTLIASVGYWLKFGGNEEIQICGTKLGDEIQVEAGWNMFGVFGEDIPVSQLTTTPPGIIATYIFGFEEGYEIADTLRSGKGYWVRVTSDGVINLNSGSTPKGGAENQLLVQLDKKWGKIIITDNAGKSFTLYAVNGQADLNRYELPPVPPSGIFDIRYGSGRFAEDLNRTAQSIEMLGIDYPVSVKVENMIITLQDESGTTVNAELEPGEELTINDNSTKKLFVISTELITPLKYSLEQNYPNPFNPVTTIKFSVPETANVTLNIYNVLGEKVGILVNSKLDAGKYSFQWKAENVASGIYIYELRTNKFISTKKMILLK